MRFSPMTEEEIQRAGLLEPGIYDFTVAQADDAVSKKGNPMIKVKLQVFAGAGQERVIYDYLLEVMAYKLRHFCYSIGKGKEYEAGSITADAITGASGRVEVDIEKQEGYSDKNIVVDYQCAESKTQAKAAEKAAAAKAPAGEEIPF